MIQNLAEYFLPEQEYYLDNISYKRIETFQQDKENNLKCTDSLTVEVMEETVKITLMRSLNFEPERKKEIHWAEINLAQEFRSNGGFVLANLLSRISLLIGQITSAYGQQPLILPIGIIQPENN